MCYRGRGKEGAVMKMIVSAAAAALTLASCSAQQQENQQQAGAQNTNSSAAQRPSKSDAEAYMRKAEEDWAALAVKKDPGLLERILADDYVGVSSESDVRSKARQVELERTEDNSAQFASTKLDYVNYRHFGDTVLAQGAESLKWRDSRKPDLRLIWTDVWMFRNGKWQIVASQDSVLPEKK
jgi:ketosteroid isomerase-like protein